MKKPPQTAQGKLRRNFQKAATRKGGPVFLEQEAKPTSKPAPTTRLTSSTRARRKRHRMRLQPGQPSAGSKLNSVLTRELCDLIRRQATLEDACNRLHISREAVWEWRGKGQNGDHPAYVAFEDAITEALAESKQTLIEGIATDRDIKGKIFLLKNRFPHEYRDRIVQEVSGPEGMPLAMATQTFHVEITLDPRDQPLEKEGPFILQHPDGRREKWLGGNRFEPLTDGEEPES
jgi:hypothetical protein